MHTSSAHMQGHKQTQHRTHAKQVQTMYMQGQMQLTYSVHASAHADSLRARAHADSTQHTCKSTHAEEGRCTWVVSNASPEGEPHSCPHSAQLHQQKPGHENGEAQLAAHGIHINHQHFQRDLACRNSHSRLSVVVQREGSMRQLAAGRKVEGHGGGRGGARWMEVLR